VRRTLTEFREFITQANLVALAVAVVIGSAFGAAVSSLVRNLITPFIAALGGQPDFSELAFTINDSRFRYGEFANALLSFLFVAVALFVFVRPFNTLMARLERESGPAERSRPCPECLSDIPVAARRCAHCTAEVGAADEGHG
jgi:large conductance mechanosensitive channel